MRFEVDQKRTALAGRKLSLVLSAMTVGVVVITGALISSQQGTSNSIPAANPSYHSSSSPLRSSLISSTSSNSTTTRSSTTTQSSGGQQYPLVWAPNSPVICDNYAGADLCIDAMVAVDGQATNVTSSATTVIQGNTTTIVKDCTTTIYVNNVNNGVGNSSMSVSYCSGSFSYQATVTLLVQDAVTGQNINNVEGYPLSNGCGIFSTGFTRCYVYTDDVMPPFMAPAGRTYNITVFVSNDQIGCGFQVARAQCPSTWLAPPRTLVWSDPSTTSMGSGCPLDKFGSATCIPCPTDTACGSFYYGSSGTNASSQVKVNYVQATESVCKNCGAVNGQEYVSFAVNFENTGSSPIYIAAGPGGLDVFPYGNFSNYLQVVSPVGCAGTPIVFPLEGGQNYTLYSSGCSTGFDYKLVQSGTVGVTFTFQWTTSSQASTFPEATIITAHFSLP